MRNASRAVFLVLAGGFPVGFAQGQVTSLTMAPPPAPPGTPGTTSTHKPPRSAQQQPSAANATHAAKQSNEHGARCDGTACPKHGTSAEHVQPEQAQIEAPNDDQPSTGALEAMMDKLGLADPARKKLQNLNSEAQKRATALKAEADRTKHELQHKLEQDMPDTSGMKKQFDQLDELKAEFNKLWIKAQLEASKLLTPEQRAKLQRYSQGDFRRPTPQPTAAEPKTK